MKKKYVKIMFLSLTLLTISTTATYAVQPKDDKKENERKLRQMVQEHEQTIEKWNIYHY